MADSPSSVPPIDIKGGDALSGAKSWGGTSSGTMFSPFVVNQGGGLWWVVAAVILGFFLWKKRG